MKKIAFTLLMFLTLSLNAQNNAFVKFMGIPVDGSKSEMIYQLEKEGFIYNKETDWSEGIFNGEQVYVYVHTNSFETVDRIVIQLATPYNESDIKIRFNNLVNQYEYDPGYSAFTGNQCIGEKENVSYEMSLNNRQYEAVFHQCISKEEIEEIRPYIIDNYSFLIEDSLNLAIMKEEGIEIGDTKDDNINALLSMYAKQYEKNNEVWLMIIKMGLDEYKILIMYDNLYKLDLMEDGF